MRSHRPIHTINTRIHHIHHSPVFTIHTIHTIHPTHARMHTTHPIHTRTRGRGQSGTRLALFPRIHAVISPASGVHSTRRRSGNRRISCTSCRPPSSSRLRRRQRRKKARREDRTGGRQLPEQKTRRAGHSELGWGCGVPLHRARRQRPAPPPCNALLLYIQAQWGLYSKGSRHRVLTPHRRIRPRSLHTVFTPSSHRLHNRASAV